MEIEGSSSVLIKAVFPFFIYTVPENVLLCLIFYLIFLLLQKYKVSQYIRKFYFIKATLLQTLIEGNVIYFVYVCLGHLSTAFHFIFGDKASLAFTVVFLWVVMMFSFTFYSLTGHFLQKKAGYFLPCVYRCNLGYFLTTVKNLVRNFLRGAIFYFLH